MKYEYRIIHYGGGTGVGARETYEGLEKRINELATEGFRIVQTIQRGESTVFVLERELVENVGDIYEGVH